MIDGEFSSTDKIPKLSHTCIISMLLPWHSHIKLLAAIQPMSP